MNKQFYISTGYKAVMYTLWSQIVEDEGKEPFRGRPYYIKNIASASEDVALKEATKYASEHGGTFIGIYDAPGNERSNSFDFAGVHFIRKKFKSGIAYIGAPSDEFFKLWREKKEELKSEGYSLSKYDGLWNVFYNNNSIPNKKGDIIE